MRFCYLRIALLTSAIAAKAFADTAETGVKLAASRTTSSSTFDRDDSALSAVTEMHAPTSNGDEDRAGATINEFANAIGRSHDSKHLKGLAHKYLKPILRDRKTPKAVYDDLNLFFPKHNLFLDMEWTKWAYFVYQVGRRFNENEYEFLMTAMSVIYDADALFEILLTGIRHTQTRKLATNLAKESNGDVKRVFYQRNSKLAVELFQQEQHSEDTIYKISRDRIFAYLKKHVRDDELPDKEFPFLISYLSVLFNKKNAFGTALAISHKFTKDAALLQALLSLSNFHSLGCIKSLVSIWLDASIPPSKIVSMLVQGQAEENQFTILFSNGPAKNFWLHYSKEYTELSTDDNFTRFAKSDFEQVLKMMFAMVEQKPLANDKYLAKGTFLQMLFSPSAAHISSSHEQVIKLMSMFLLDRTLPSDVIYMLTRDEADAEKFYVLFVNKASRSFWVRYLKMYTQMSEGTEDFTRTANTDLQRLLVMLRNVRKPKSSTASKYLANSIILKILLSPAITSVITSRKYLEETAIYWLHQKLPPSAVVFMLVHEEVESNYFKILFAYGPSSQFWMDYTNAYYAIYPSPQNRIMSTLTYVFGDAKLTQLLKAALTDEATRQLAESLLNQLNWRERSLIDNS